MSENKTINAKRMKTGSFILAFALIITRILDYKLFYNGKTLSDKGLVSIIGLVIALVFVITEYVIIKKDKTHYQFNLTRSVVEGTGMLFSALVLIPAVVSSLVYYMGVKRGEIWETDESATAMYVVLVVLALISVVFFVSCAVSKIGGVNLIEKLKLLTVLPVLFSMAFIVFNYVHNTMFIIRSDNYLVLAGAFGICIGFITAGTALAGFGKKTGDGKYALSGVSAGFIFAFSFGVSEFLLKYIMPERIKTTSAGSEYFFIAMGMFFLFMLLGLKFTEIKTEDKENISE